MVGLFLGGTDFTDLFVVMRAGIEAPPPYASLVEAKAAGAAVFVFLVVKMVNRVRRAA